MAYFYFLFYFYFFVSKPEPRGRHTEEHNSLHNVTLLVYNLD